MSRSTTKSKTFRSLSNYKALHAATAKEKGRERELAEASTLTEARRAVFGAAKKGGR